MKRIGFIFPLLFLAAWALAAQEAPPVHEIKMTAKKYEYNPEEIRVKQGERVRLLITATDRKHGFEIKGLEVKTELPEGKETAVEFTPDKPGTYEFRCSVRCGWRHSSMKGRLIVEPASNEVQGAGPTAQARCPATLPNGWVAPGNDRGDTFHGNGKLWTALPPDGKVLITPEKDGSLGTKLPWWRAVEGRLTITGRRLDAPGEPLQADIPEGYGETGFQASGVYFPSEGCWEITGRAGDAQLTFVLEVRVKRELRGNLQPMPDDAN